MGFSPSQFMREINQKKVHNINIVYEFTIKCIAFSNITRKTEFQMSLVLYLPSQKRQHTCVFLEIR